MHALETECIKEQVHAPLLCTRDSALPAHSAQSLNSVHIQQDQRLLVIKNAFLVLILGFHVIDIDCPVKLRRSCFVLVHPCVPLHRSIRLRFSRINSLLSYMIQVPDSKFAAKTSEQVIIPPACKNKKISTELIENWLSKTALKSFQKQSQQLRAILAKIEFNAVVFWLTLGCLIALHCRLFRVGWCSGACRFTMGLHHLVSHLFRFHRIAALRVNTCPTPFPFPTECQPRMHCRQ